MNHLLNVYTLALHMVFYKIEITVTVIVIYRSGRI